jgi:hypothetical protein
MDGMLELVAIVLVVLLPTVPVVAFLGLALRRARPVDGTEVVAGRRSDTPFVLIGWVGIFIGAVVLLAVMLTLIVSAVG